jgi:hypothetical protein
MAMVRAVTPKTTVLNQANSRQQLQQELLTGFLFTTSRGDWTPLELFFVGLQGWDALFQVRM